MRHATRWIAAAVIAAAAAWAPAADAAVEADSGNVEVFVGWYILDEDVPGESLDDITFGLRGGYNFTKHFMLQFGAQMFTTDYDIGAGEVEIDQWSLDMSMGWYVNPDSKAVFLFYGGPGWNNYDVDFPVLPDLDDSAMSLHAGMGLFVQCSDSFYIRPDLRFKWIDGSNSADDRSDWEATFGFGWMLGGS